MENGNYYLGFSVWGLGLIDNPTRVWGRGRRVKALPKDPILNKMVSQNRVEQALLYGAICEELFGGFPKLRYHCPHNKDYSILGCILGSPNLWKLPCQFLRHSIYSYCFMDPDRLRDTCKDTESGNPCGLSSGLLQGGSYRGLL